MAWLGLSPSASGESSRFLRSWWQGLAALAESAFGSGSAPAFVVWSPIFLASGIGCYFALPVEPSAVFIMVPGLIVGLAWFLMGPAAQWFGIQADRPVLRSFLAIFAVFLAGLAVAQYRTWTVDAPVLEQRLGPVWIEGQVANVEIRRQDMRLTFDPVVIESWQANVTLPDITPPDATPQRVRIVVRQGMEPPLAGQRLRVRAVLYPPAAPDLPGGFDFQRRAYFERLGAVGYSLSTPLTVPVSEQPDAGAMAMLTSFGLALSRLRQDIAAHIGSVLPGDVGAVAKALLTGRRGGIDPATWDKMRDSGLAHLLAISGLHMGMIAAFAFWLSRAVLACHPGLALRQPIKKWAALVALGASFAYLLLTGATVPTQRAYAMTGLVLLAIMTDRVAISLRLVAVAALIILIITPESLLKPSFQMSFAAVTALVAVYGGLRQHMGEALVFNQGNSHQNTLRKSKNHRSRLRLWPPGFWLRKVILYIGGIALSTIVATVATAPFAVYHFNRLAVYGLLANVVSVPITAFWIMPCGFLALLFMPLGWEDAFLQAMGVGISAVLEIAHSVSDLPGAARTLISPTSWGLVMIVLGGLWLCLWNSRLRWFGIPMIATGLLSVSLNPPPHILIDGQARLVAVRLDHGDGRILAVSSLRRSQRTQQEWMRRTASQSRIAWSQYQAPFTQPGRHSSESFEDSGLTHLFCDSMACIYETRGVKVALVLNADALPEDCRRADIVVALVPIFNPCPARLGVIDRFDLWKNGAYAVWLDDGAKPRIVSVADRRGARPWAVQPAGKSRQSKQYLR